MTKRVEPKRTGRTARAPRVPFALLVTGLLIGGLVLLLALNTFSAANELQRNGLADKDAVVAAQVEDLRNQVAAAGAPGNISAAAEQMGMVPAGHPAFLVVGADGVIRVLGKPKSVKAAPLAVPSAASKKPKASKSAKASSAKASKTASPTSRRTGAPKPGRSTSAAAKPTSSPKPTPTPTPVVTLSGGPR